jgi:hypothetical protein
LLPRNAAAAIPVQALEIAAKALDSNRISRAAG